MKRIYLSFDKKGEKKVKTLESTNRKLRELLKTHEKRESLKSTRKDAKWGYIFECIRRHASSVHMALKKGWCCSCETSHNATLQLEQRNQGGWDSEFNVAFDMSEDRIKTIRRVVMIRAMKETTKSKVLKEVAMVSEQQQNLNQLRRDFESKSTPQVNVLHRPQLHPTVSDSSSASSPGTSLRSIFSKSSSTRSSTTTSTLNGTETLLADTKFRLVRAQFLRNDVIF